jgi:DNA-directed RNA polymerase I, II, and III subunit RPABC2
MSDIESDYSNSDSESEISEKVPKKVNFKLKPSISAVNQKNSHDIDDIDDSEPDDAESIQDEEEIDEIEEKIMSQLGGESEFSDDDSEEENESIDEENEDEDSNNFEKEPEARTKAVSSSKKVSLNIDHDDDDDDEYEDNYLQKFDNELSKNYIQEFHPECLNHNYDEITKLSIVVRNSDGIIVDPLHKTIPYLTKYEKARIIGQRAKQIETGSKPYVKVPENIIDSYIIAELELKEKKIPFIIKRPIPGGSFEYWNLRDLEMVAF